MVIYRVSCRYSRDEDATALHGIIDLLEGRKPAESRIVNIARIFVIILRGR